MPTYKTGYSNTANAALQPAGVAGFGGDENGPYGSPTIAEQYPATHGGVTGGALGGLNCYAYANPPSPRMQGGWRGGNSTGDGQFVRINVAPGTYDLDLCAGQVLGGYSTHVAVFDGESGTPLFTPMQVVSNTGGDVYVMDAMGNKLSPSAWETQRQTRRITVTADHVRVQFGDGGLVGNTDLIAVDLLAVAGALTAPSLALGAPTQQGALPYTITAPTGGTAPYNYALDVTPAGGSTTRVPASGLTGSLTGLAAGTSYSIVPVATDSATPTPASTSGQAQTRSTLPAPALQSIAVGLAASTVAGGATVQATATGTFSDGVNTTTRVLTSADGLQWSQTANERGVNASGLSTAPNATPSDQSVTVTATAGGKSGSASYTVPAAAAPPGTPTIRVRDGASGQLLASGAVLDLGMQAGRVPQTRCLFIDNGNPQSTDEALTGLVVVLPSSARWLGTTMDYPSAAATVLLIASPPGAVPVPAYADAQGQITSNVPGVAPFLFTVKGAVAAPDQGEAQLADMEARVQRIEATVLTMAATAGTMDQQATKSAAATSVQLQTDGVPVTSGSADAIAGKAQAALAPSVAAATTAATGAETAATGAQTAAAAARDRVLLLAIDTNGRVTATNGGAALTPDQVATLAALELALPELAKTGDLSGLAKGSDLTGLAKGSDLMGLAKGTDLTTGLNSINTVLGQLPAGVRGTLDTLLSTPRAPLTAPPPTTGASPYDMMTWTYTVGHARNLQVTDDQGTSTFGADGTTLLARKNAAQSATGLTTAVAGA